jgi:MoxR-like ATPase
MELKRLIRDHLKPVSAFAAIRSSELEAALAEQLGESAAPAWLTQAADIVRDRLRDLIGAVKDQFVERDQEAEAVAAALLSGVSIVLFGPPGTAKTALVKEFAKRCGLGPVDELPADEPGGKKSERTDDDGRGFFEYLLTSHTMPEELFGGADLQALTQHGKFQRVVTGKLPRAEIAFLDEMFRGGSHILNTLLTIINEKRFDRGDGGGTRHVPLLGLVGAANTPPQDPDQEAFFDRFPLRVWVRSVFEQVEVSADEDSTSARKLLQRAVDGERLRLQAGWSPARERGHRGERMLACTNDFRLARVHILRSSASVGPASQRFIQFEQMFRLVRDRAKLSDRTFGQLWLFAAALDWLRGHPDLTASFPSARGHLDVFRHVSRSAHDVAWLADRVEQHTAGLQHSGAA